MNKIKNAVKAGTCDIDYEFTQACTNGNIDIVHFLMDYVPEIRSSPFALAARNGHLDILKLLVIKYGIATRSTVIIDMACEGGHIDVVEYLITHMTPLYDISAGFAESIRYGRLELVKYLLEKYKVPLNRVSLLPEAIANNHMKVALYLYRKGANPNKVAMHNYQLAIMYALYRATPNKKNGIAVIGFDGYMFVEAMERVRVNMESTLPLSSDVITYIFDMNYAA